MKDVVRSVTVFLMLAAAGPLMASGDALMVKDAWIREAPPGQEVLAGYMVLENHSATEQVLSGVRSPVFGSVEIHKTEMHEGMMRMVAQPRLAVPGHGRVELAPGGLHLMLMKPTQALHKGDKVELVLERADGAEIPVTAEVRMGGMKGSDMGGGHEHGHQH